MGIQAFTNEVGTHSRFQVNQDIMQTHVLAGFEWLWGHDNTVVLSTHSHEVERSYKPSPYIWGDHKSSYDYTRSIAKVTRDSPGMYKEIRIWSGLPATTTTVVFHLTSDFGILEYTPPAGAEGNSLDESVTKALNNLVQNSSGMGENLGQARQTIDELASLTNKLGSALLALKRGQLVEAARALAGLTGKKFDIRNVEKSLADLWLSYVYGIKPLLSDLYNLNEAVHNILQKDIIISGHGRGREERTHFDPAYLGGKFRLQYAKVGTARTKLSARVDNPLLYLLNSAGLINPAAIAWELVPWSFVIDWFIPVGQTLQACSATVGLTPLGGQSTVQINTVTNVTLNLTFADDHHGFISGFVDGGDYEVVHFNFDRYAYTGGTFPLPRLYADVTPYSTPRALNALALLRQLV